MSHNKINNMRKIFVLCFLASVVQLTFSQNYLPCGGCGGRGYATCGGCWGSGYTYMGNICVLCNGSGTSICAGCGGAGGTYVQSTPQQTYQQTNSQKTSSSESRYGYKDCHICHGTGVCQTCGGDGWQHNSFGLDDSPCANCHRENGKRTGKCSRCQGTGEVYGVK